MADPGRAPLRILITNLLLGRHGTGVVVRDLALGLSRRGHFPIVYSPELDSENEISARGIPTITKLAQLGEAPDVIHGQHFTTAAEAFILFPETPRIFVCHGWRSWKERPPRFPRLLYAAVSETTRDRIVQTEGIAADRVRILPNAVDLDRVPERPAPLAERPTKALAFGNMRFPNPVLQTACGALGVELTGLGSGSRRVVQHPEAELVHHDLVFATGRSAIEALCCGCAVILCDDNGLGPMVTTETYAQVRRQNFALRALTRPFSAKTVTEEILRFDAKDVGQVVARIRHDADLDRYLDGIVEYYRTAIATFRAVPPTAEENWRALHDFLYDALPGPGRAGSVWSQERADLFRRAKPGPSAT